MNTPADAPGASVDLRTLHNPPAAGAPRGGTRMSRRASSIALYLLLAGCATAPAADKAPPALAESPPAADAVVPYGSPLQDAGRFHGEIPQVLVRAVTEPYARPQPLDCARLNGEIVELDLVLGADLDSATNPADKENLALQALVSGVTGFVPYFGWIRRMTGIDRHERRALAAITAGKIRRGYLKGLGEAHACPPPASPTRTPQPPAVKPPAA